MFERPHATHTLGLDLDAFSLKGVAISLVRGKPRLDEVIEFSVEFSQSEEGDVKPLYNENDGKQLAELAKKHLTVTTMGTQDVLIRSMDLKLKKEKDIDAVLAFQAEPLLPYPVENALVDKIILSQDSEGTKLSIAAVRKDHLENHLKLWQSLDIEPEVISAAPQALALFAAHFIETNDPYYILHLGIENSFCLLINQKKLIAAQAIPSGIGHLAETLAKENDNKSQQQQTDSFFSAPHPDENLALKQAVESLRLMIMRTVYGLGKQIKGQEVSQLLITGPGANIEGLARSLYQPLNKTLINIPDSASFGMDGRELQKFALPIGAALSALPNCKAQINFRQDEHAYPSPWKRLKMPMLTYLALCCGIGLALFAFGKAYEAYEEAHAKQQYLELLNVMNKPYDLVETEFANSGPNKRQITADQIPPVTSLKHADIEQRLDFLEKQIQSTTYYYPLQPNVPLVSDFLAWLSTHPAFAGASQNHVKTPSLQIESLSYTIVKRPEPTKKQDKYQVKIDLEFSSPIPKMAREFHDALIAPNDFVDPKGEIKWSSNRDRYRTSFYLKDKTIYP